MNKIKIMVEESSFKPLQFMSRGPDPLTELISEPEPPKHYEALTDMQKELNELDDDLSAMRKAFEEVPIDP